MESGVEREMERVEESRGRWRVERVEERVEGGGGEWREEERGDESEKR